MKEYRSAVFIPTFPEAQALLKRGKSKLLQKAKKAWMYELQKNKTDAVLLVITGMGQALTQEAAEEVFKHYKISQLYLFGVAGALREELKRPQAFYISEVKNLKNQSLSSSKHVDSFASATAVTVDHVIQQTSEKRLLQENYLADLVEMESFPLAQLCQNQKIPFTHIRWIMDEFQDQLPSVSDFVDPWGKIKIVPLVFSLLKNPRLCFELVGLARKSRQSLKAMTLFLDSFYEKYL
ncbi:MAG: hypothetical protein HQM15_11170 [Deltaproteobacteria bacterium]|nr:hypothetical protein [Deltaproteobacteria bacterium]